MTLRVRLLRTILTVALVAAVLIPALPVSADPGWLGDWEKRVKLTIDNTDIDDTLSNFPALVYLSTSSGRNSDDVSFIFDELESDANRKKIAVTTSDGTTQCYVEVEKWDDANEKAWLWFKAPNVSSSTDTDFYLYYDKTKDDNTTYVGDPNSTPAENVWDANFKLVCHMHDDPDTSHVRDSTGNDNDGTKKAANEPIEIGGKIAKAQDLDGSDDMVTVSPISLPKFSISAWIEPDGLQVYGAAIVTDKYPPRVNYAIYFTSDLTLEGGMYIGGWYATPTTELIDGVWSHVVITYDQVNFSLFVNGTLIGSTPLDIIPSSSGSDLRIGTRWDIGSYFKGIIDEVRLSDIARTAAWYKASYESGRDDLLDFGEEKMPPYLPGAPADFSLALSGDTINASWTMGTYAATTVVMRQANRYPVDVTDGVEAYNGTGTSFDDAGLNIEDNEYFYRAWSHNDTGYSIDYAQGLIGGIAMLALVVGLIVVALTGAAFWRKEPMLYMSGVIGWLALTFLLYNLDYPGGNDYLPYAVAGFCLSVTLVMAVQTVRVFYSARVTPPTQREVSRETQEEHKRKVMNITRKKERPWYDM